MQKEVQEDLDAKGDLSRFEPRGDDRDPLRDLPASRDAAEGALARRWHERMD